MRHLTKQVLNKSDVPFFKYLESASKKARKSIIKKTNQKQVSAICKVCRNVLDGKIAISTEQRGKLCKYKKTLRALADKKVKFRKKKIILAQSGGSLIPLLLNIAAPILAALFNKKNER